MRRMPGGAMLRSWSKARPEACARRWRTVDPSGPAGSSRSTVPSSTATNAANPTSSFPTEAMRVIHSGSPASPTVCCGPVTPAETVSAGHPATSGVRSSALTRAPAARAEPLTLRGDGGLGGGSGIGRLQCQGQDLVHRLDRMEGDVLAHLLRYVVEVTLVALREDDLLKTGAVGRKDLLLDSPDRE